MAKKSNPPTEISIPNQLIERRIYLVRDQKVMLDEDLAELYAVPTSRLNEQVTRNLDRFPEDFMFQLSREEALSLRSQNAILKSGRGQHRKYAPRAFTEHGILMLSSVLRSERAVQVNIAIMRTFVRIHQVLATNEDLARKVAQHDRQIAVLFQHVQKLLAPAPVKKHPIGFAPPRD